MIIWIHNVFRTWHKGCNKKAKEQERNYDWFKAAKSYEQALDSESITVSFAAKTWERIGFCYSRASAQTENLKEFKTIRQLAVEAYKNAAKLFEKEGMHA